MSLQLSFTRVDSNRQLPTVNRLFSYLSLYVHLRQYSIPEVVIFHPNVLARKDAHLTSRQNKLENSAYCLIRHIVYLCHFLKTCFFPPFYFQLHLLRRRTSVVRVTATKHWMLLQRPLCFHRIMRKFYVFFLHCVSDIPIIFIAVRSSPIRLSLSCESGKARRRNRSLAVTTGRKRLPYGLVVAAAAATAVVVKKDTLAASTATMNPDLTAGSCRRTLRAAGYLFSSSFVIRVEFFCIYLGASFNRKRVTCVFFPSSF